MRRRGRVPRTQINPMMRPSSLAKNQIQEGTQVRNGNGADHPPRNSVIPRPLMANIPRYSPRKNRANLKPEYWRKYPAMISDSPSGKSKGERLVSAVAAIMKRMNPAKPHGVSTYQWGKIPEKPACFCTISTVDNEPAAMMTATEESSSGTS